MEEHNKYFGAEISRVKDEQHNLISLAVESALKHSKSELEMMNKKLLAEEGDNKV